MNSKTSSQHSPEHSMNCAFPRPDADSSNATQIDTDTFPPRLPRIAWTWLDVIIPLLAGTALFLWSWQASRRLGPNILTSNDMYLQADNMRVYHNMTDLFSNHYRTKVHPLFSLFCCLPTLVLKKVVGLEPSNAFRLVLASSAAVWIAGLFILFRLIGLARLDAGVFTALGGVAASTLFWFCVPETFPFGAISLLVPMIVLAAGARYRLPEWTTVAASVASLSMTSTNWMAGLLVAGFRHPLRIAMRLSLYAFVIVTLLWGVQKVVFPTAQFFIGDREEANYMRPLGLGPAVSTARTFFLSSMIMPEFGLVRDQESHRILSSIEQSKLRRTGLAGRIGLGAWVALLAAGTIAVFRSSVDHAFRACLVLLIGGQLALHICYGDEVFLYSLHFAPLLVILAGIACMSTLRKPSLLFALALIPCAAINNLGMFDRMAEFVLSDGFNPVGGSHIVIGVPNSLDTLKTYVESEGDFSPGFGSYGISFWASNPNTGKITTPKMEASGNRRGLPEDGGLIPWAQWSAGIVTVTTEVCEVLIPSPKGEVFVTSARAHLVNTEASEQKLSLYVEVRGVGPAGYRIDRIEADARNDALSVNGHCAIVSDEPASTVGVSGADIIDREVSSGRFPTEKLANSATGDCSGALRFDLTIPPQSTITRSFVCPVMPGRKAPGHRWIPSDKNVFIDDIRIDPADGSTPQPDPGLDFYRSLRADRLFHQARALWNDKLDRIKVQLPDPRWSQGLGALLAHIEMAMNAGALDVAAINYNVYTRDAAYMINVLQKAHQFELAQAAISYLLTHPFSGRPYPEADNTGEILWIVGEHWRLTRDAKWLEAVYPSVRALAATIKFYRTTQGPHWVQMDAIAFGDAVPQDRRQELKAGRCDGFHPEFTEAFDIAGLRAAAELATAVGQPSEANAYQALADELSAEYAAQFGKDLAKNYGSYSVLWPCHLLPFDAPKSVKSFGKIGPQISKSWRYFPLSTAHQGLFVGSRLASVGTLVKHLDHKQMRGWYAFDEGGPSAQGAWSQARTRWDPEIAMPHGWATAEMWLLMRDALLFEDGERLTLFAGIPESWFVDPHGMRVENMPSWFGECSMDWVPTPTGARLKFSGKASPPKGFVLRLPTKIAANVVSMGAQRLSPSTGAWLLPTTTKSVSVQFDRRLLQNSPDKSP